MSKVASFVSIVAVTLVKGLSEFFANYSINFVGFSVVRDLRNLVYIRIVDQSVAFFSKQSTGKLMSAITSDIEKIQMAVSQAAADFLKQVFTLAGFAQGRVVDDPRVLGAATNPAQVETMKQFGVIFSRNDPGGGLIGASGLFLGLGRLFGMEGVCLMGETSGYFVDPRSAEAVLKVLAKILHVEIDFTALEAKAHEIDRIAQKIHEAESRSAEAAPSAGPTPREDLGYIG
jgi:uncharacterized protein (TIGR00162 family)